MLVFIKGVRKALSTSDHSSIFDVSANDHDGSLW